jgi:hypothetical protein
VSIRIGPRSKFRAPDVPVAASARRRSPRREPTESSVLEVEAASDVDDTGGERCPCGLRVDKDHRPETCDLKAKRLELAQDRQESIFVGRRRRAKAGASDARP